MGNQATACRIHEPLSKNRPAGQVPRVLGSGDAGLAVLGRPQSVFPAQREVVGRCRYGHPSGRAGMTPENVINGQPLESGPAFARCLLMHLGEQNVRTLEALRRGGGEHGDPVPSEWGRTDPLRSGTNPLVRRCARNECVTVERPGEVAGGRLDASGCAVSRRRRRECGRACGRRDS
jgi:hypothetical protein